ncbi:hypothetical protein F4809DRAFT_481664 [Biscogniauxia mediterranea]|nr:hypothetical protein F4809DRAFT_481664 [Biscogniauxia mediterranea]
MHLHVPTLVLALALAPGEGEGKGDSLYNLARRDCPVGSPGIPQYLRCVTECRVAGGDEGAQRRCVGGKCSHICKDPEHLKQQQGKEKEKEGDERDL